jgi:hypothetical protein
MKFVNLEVFEVIRRLGCRGDGRDPLLLHISLLGIESASCSELGEVS